MKLDGFSLAATTNDLTRAEDAHHTADLIEFRMDSAEDPLEQLSRYDGSLPIIATNRTKSFGGEATDDGRLDRLSAASEFDCVKLVDIELETARGMQWALDDFRRNDARLIISHHDFDDTPSQDVLDAIVEQCWQYGDVAKVATYPQDEGDALRLLKAIHTATEKGIDVAGIAMDEIGSHTRVVGPLYGSKLGYAPLATDKNEYAPGQIPLHRLASLIEAMSPGADDPALAGDLRDVASEQRVGSSN